MTEPRKRRKATPAEAAAAEVLAGSDTVTAIICGHPVSVLPIKDWKTRAIRALREGDFDSWAETALVDGDFVTWQIADPSLADVEAFFEEWGLSSGQEVGKSLASLRSSNGITRR